MLKTLQQEQMWLVTQPDHAQVSGYLAAPRCENSDFARPRYFASLLTPNQSGIQCNNTIA